MQTSIVIQAGGESRRMGQNKALVPFLGQPMIQRVVERLGGLGDEMLVTTNQPEAFQFLGLPLVADVLPGTGALGGLYTALLAAHAPRVLVVACDMPFVSPQLARLELDVLAAEGWDVVIPTTLEGLEPLHTVYRRETCIPAIERALQEQKRRMISWFGDVRVRELSLEEVRVVEPELRAFMNVNTPEELAAAEALAD